MTPCTRQAAAAALLAGLSLLLAACTTLQGAPGEGGSTLREHGGSRAAGAGVPRARGSRRGSAGNGRRSPAVRRRVGTPGSLCPGIGARRDHRDIPARGADPGPGVAGSRVAGGLRAGVRVHGQEEERDAPGPPGGLCAVERGEPGVDRRADRDPPPAGELEAGRQAPEVHAAHTGHPGAAHQGHGRRAADVRLLQGRRAAQGLRPEVPGVRRRADQEEALAGCRRNREAHRLPALHGRHLRSRLRQRRQGFPAVHRATGHRRVAAGQGAFSRVPRRGRWPMSCPPPSSRRSP